MAINITTEFMREWTGKGYGLFEEIGDVFVSLYFKGAYVTSFNQTMTTEEEITKACQEDWGNRMKETTGVASAKEA